MADNKNKFGEVNVENMKKALAVVNAYSKETKKINSIMQAQNEAWNGISSAVFGISGADWFDKVPKTTEELAKQHSKIKEIDAQLQIAGKSLNDAFSASLPDMQKKAKDLSESIGASFRKRAGLVSVDLTKAFDIKNPEKFKGAISEIVDEIGNINGDFNKTTDLIKKLPKELQKNKKLIQEIRDYAEEENKYKVEHSKILEEDFDFLNAVHDKHMKQKILEAIAENKIDQLLEHEGFEALQILNTNENIAAAISESGRAFIMFNDEAKLAKQTLSETHKSVIDIKKGLVSIGKNLASGIIDRMLEFDKVIHDTQKTTGIMFTENAAAMTTLTRKTSEFGMSIGQTAEFMGAMGDELRTTDFNVLGKAADDLKAVQLATGMASENLSAMAGEMMRNGAGSEEVKKAMEDANVTAKQFGVSSKKVLDGMGRNITKMRTMGFTGGEKSLTKMVATAERLRMNVDEIFDVAKKARSIEGAMEMAAELQLAGGSFANINPMDLLSAARKGPAELQKILTTMGGDIGKFDKDTGKMTFDPVDVDRLQIVADATGQSLDSIQKMIEKNAQDNQKVKYLPNLQFDGLTDKDGKKIDADAVKNTLLDSIDGKTGLVIKGSIMDKAGITDLANITDEQMQAVMRDEAAKAANLEEQAKQNQGFSDAMTAMKDALLNIFTYLQPVVTGLTTIFQGIAKFLNVLGPFAPILLGLIVALAVLPMLIGAMGKLAFSMNPKNLASVFKSGGVEGALRDRAAGGGGSSPVQNLSNDTKVSNTGGGFKTFMTNLKEGLVQFGSDAAKVLKGAGTLALSIVMIGSSLGVLALLFSKVSPSLLLAFGAAIIELSVAMFIMSKISKGISLTDLAKAAAGLLMVSIALIPFSVVAEIFGKVDWMKVLAGIGILALIVLGLMGLGMMMMGPQLIGLLLGVGILVGIAASLALVGLSFLALASGLSALSTVDWNAFSGIGPALLGVTVALGAFALAGLMFVNPIMLVGMALMIGTLLAISLVLIPLAMALDMGGKGLTSMADGVVKLSDSLQKLDFEKLDKLKEFSSEMASAASGGAVAEAMGKLAEAMASFGSGGGAGGGGGTSQPVIVELRLPNGGVLQTEITEYLAKRG